MTRLYRPGEGQKALDVLKDFLRKRLALCLRSDGNKVCCRAPEDGLICGWELFHVLNFIDVPSKKVPRCLLQPKKTELCEALRAQLECERGSPSQSPIGKDIDRHWIQATGRQDHEEPFAEVEEVLEA